MPTCKNVGLWKKGPPRNKSVLLMRKDVLGKLRSYS
ncbi:hypothetical protein HMPREF1168_01717 [Aeromonas veronii AMC34]|uniref:Uncharacterized protein n=1 Tax=Aeromonas veronii AMC34 TaxID=1073383 RepID=K1IYT7_AERVE|nr:hypothetical protein HMPREF1168_01717 [Aeromonas veronii AMC34]